MIIHELSVRIEEKMDVFPGDPPFRARVAATYDRDGCNVLDLAMGTHTGTHVDVPRHFLPDGAAIDAMPPERFFGPAVFLDVTREVRETGRIDLAAADLTAVQPGDFVVLRTGWEERRGTPGFFSGLPQFTADSAARLAGLGVRLLGTDMPTVLADPAGVLPTTGMAPEATAMHAGLLSRGILILEGMVGLAPLSGRRLLLSCLPLRITGADGSPVRAVAIEYDGNPASD